MGSRLRNNDQYVPGDILIQTVKVLSYYNDLPDDESGKVRFHYRLLVVLQDMPSFEFIIDCPLLADNNGTNIQRTFLVGAYANYGKADVQKHVSVVDDLFILSYYDLASKTYTAAIYQMISNVEGDNDKVLFSQIFGGYQLTDIIFLDQIFVPVILYK